MSRPLSFGRAVQHSAPETDIHYLAALSGLEHYIISGFKGSVEKNAYASKEFPGVSLAAKPTMTPASLADARSGVRLIRRNAGIINAQPRK
jgi:hypothetical protein